MEEVFYSYRFVCEYCGHTNPWRPLPVDEAMGADWRKKQFEKGKFGINMKGKCTQCGKVQSWKVKHNYSIVVGYILLGLVLCVLITGFLNMYSTDIGNVVRYFIFIGPVVGFILGYKKLAKAKSAQLASNSKPEIVWHNDLLLKIQTTDKDVFLVAMTQLVAVLNALLEVNTVATLTEFNRISEQMEKITKAKKKAMNRAQDKSQKKVKTNDNLDRETYINRSVNDLCLIFGGVALNPANLEKHRDWIRNVGQDLYNLHGFSAMQEVFQQVKTHYPMFQSALSQFWDGIGDWAD